MPLSERRRGDRRPVPAHLPLALLGPVVEPPLRQPVLPALLVGLVR